MKEKRSEVGRAIERGLREAIAFEQGELPNVRTTRRMVTARDSTVTPPPAFPPDRVRRVRDGMGLSQAVFASALNVSGSTVRAWEQGKRTPDGPSLRLLELAERDPKSFLRTVIVRIGERYRSLPLLDDRSADEIIGYDEDGLPS